jgi:hypothetical protein
MSSGGPVIKASNITVSVPCLFPDEQAIWMLRTTADRFGYQLRPYGLGLTYQGWVHIKVNLLKHEAKTCPTSHLLYTDARDAWFLTGPDVVAAKYNQMGCPPLMLSAQPDIFGTYAKWYEGIPWDMSKRFRYIGTPGMLCEAKALAAALGWMEDRMANGGERDDDDPVHWCLWIKEHPNQLVLDHECSIFMNAGSQMEEGMWDTVLRIEGKRVYNTVTQSYPCVLHFNGGYSHAQYGKWGWLEHYWRALGNSENPPWEAKVAAGA